jgi:hypothetical protein
LFVIIPIPALLLRRPPKLVLLSSTSCNYHFHILQPPRPAS